MSRADVPQQFCHVSDPQCLNPAGFGTARGYARNAYGPRTRARCQECGEAVCAACRTGSRGAWTCNDCAEAEQERRARKFGGEVEAVKAAILSTSG